MALIYPSLFGNLSTAHAPVAAEKTKRKAGRPKKVVPVVSDSESESDTQSSSSSASSHSAPSRLSEEEHTVSEPIAIPKRKVKKQRTKLTDEQKNLQYTDRRAYMELLRSLRKPKAH